MSFLDERKRFSRMTVDEYLAEPHPETGQPLGELLRTVVVPAGPGDSIDDAVRRQAKENLARIRVEINGL